MAAFPIVALITGAFMVLSWRGPGDYLVQNAMPLYDLALCLVTELPEWLTGLLVYLILLSQIYHLNYVAGRHEVLYRNSYLPMLFFMVLLIMIPPFMTFHPVLLINTILIFILDKLFRVYKNPSPLPSIFDAGFLIGIAILIYLPAISLVLLFILSLLILKTFSWRDWAIGFIGLLLPFFFAFVYYFWTGETDQLASKFLLNDLSQYWNTGAMAFKEYRVTIVVITLLMALTMNRIRLNFYKNTTRIRNFQQVIFIFLAVGLLSLALTGSVAVYRFAILTIPIAVMISYYFLAGKKKWWNELLFWLLIGVVVFNQLIT